MIQGVTRLQIPLSRLLGHLMVVQFPLTAVVGKGKGSKKQERPKKKKKAI